MNAFQGSPELNHNASSNSLEEEEVADLSPAQRSHAQRYALLCNLMGPITFNIVVGQYLMLFATDVLRFNPLRIALVVSLAPLVTVLRFPFLKPVRKWGRTRAYIVARCVQCAVVLALMAIPSSQLSLPLLLSLLILFMTARELGPNLVWLSLLRDITTSRDRGRFFARMRLAFTIVSLAISAAFVVFVGNSMTEGQYKGLLALSLLGLVNSCFWIRRLPDKIEGKRASARGGGSHRRSLLYLLRHSPVMRLPVLISFLTITASLPMAIIYFRQVLHVPANLVTVYVFMATLGQALFFILWGKLADMIGFRPMLIGLLTLAALAKPMIFFVPPFPAAGIDFSNLEPLTMMGAGALCLIGFANGILLSGIGIVSTSVLHHHVSPEDSLEALNLFSVVQIFIQTIIALLAGYFIQEIVLPGGIASAWNGLLHLDWYKFYAAVVAPLMMLGSIPLIRRLPNVRPWFGVSDFFSALLNRPARTIYASRRVYDEVRERRAELAHWFGINTGPLSMDPLLSLLQDPSYDVRIEAIRSLSRSGSSLAGQELSFILADEERRSLWDQTAWALGELKHLPAFDLLVLRLSPEMSPRVRAMAARALGKLGDKRAIKPLLKVLREEDRWLTVIAAASLALLQLKARDHAELALHALLRLRDREDRYELMSAFCEWLEIPTHWLLHSSSDESSWKSLQHHLEYRSPAWRRKRHESIAAFSRKDHRKILAYFKDRLDRAEPGRFPSARALCKVAGETGHWTPLSVLATAWLLYKEMD